MLKLIPKPLLVEESTIKVSYDSLKTVSEFDSSIPFEGYEILINHKEIRISASSDSGFFYAQMTLRQIRLQCGSLIPCLLIKDAPRFGYRSFMVDCVRHFFNVEQLKTLIDIAASYKFNRFHFHLTDDQGFRAEIEGFPELIEKGSARNGSHFGNVHVDDEYRAFFTESEMREINDYCRKRFIEVVPELEIPGHCSALLASYPELSCFGKCEVKTTAGIFKDILCVGNPDSEKLVIAILDKYCDIFDGSYVHIGGDEAPKVHWKSCPKCQNKLAELGLKDEEALEGWLANSCAEYLDYRGKTAICWNESLNGGNLSTSVAVQCWMDKKNAAADFSAKGGKIISSDFYHYYLDYPYGMTPLKKVYGYNPVPPNVSESNVLGVEAPIWTEHISDFERLCYMMFPRLIAVAEAGWTAKENRDYKSFLSRLGCLLDFLPVNYAPPWVWNKLPQKRLSDTLRFFKRSINKETVHAFVHKNSD